ncbi:hypothetical protein BDZ85DRAFT_268271 [Elsinoe ampelina]|uniref:Up-regulated during septation-domain-containing protein n=1 Tax=Elsinoe ampelina TaxID=302913 RepID=A0A6A6G1Y7_9PEZI|nr:hypothetical protein BDZ85DRAFT_268271 [Elsinoe ampelina]
MHALRINPNQLASVEARCIDAGRRTRQAFRELEKQKSRAARLEELEHAAKYHPQRLRVDIAVLEDAVGKFEDDPESLLLPNSLNHNPEATYWEQVFLPADKEIREAFHSARVPHDKNGGWSMRQVEVAVRQLIVLAKQAKAFQKQAQDLLKENKAMKQEVARRSVLDGSTSRAGASKHGGSTSSGSQSSFITGDDAGKDAAALAAKLSDTEVDITVAQKQLEDANIQNEELKASIAALQNRNESLNKQVIRLTSSGDGSTNLEMESALRNLQENETVREQAHTQETRRLTYDHISQKRALEDELLNLNGVLAHVRGQLSTFQKLHKAQRDELEKQGRVHQGELKSVQKALDANRSECEALSVKLAGGSEGSSEIIIALQAAIKDATHASRRMFEAAAVPAVSQQPVEDTSLVRKLKQISDNAAAIRSARGKSNLSTASWDVSYNLADQSPRPDLDHRESTTRAPVAPRSGKVAQPKTRHQDKAISGSTLPPPQRTFGSVGRFAPAGEPDRSAPAGGSTPVSGSAPTSRDVPAGRHPLGGTFQQRAFGVPRERENTPSEATITPATSVSGASPVHYNFGRGSRELGLLGGKMHLKEHAPGSPPLHCDYDDSDMGKSFPKPPPLPREDPLTAKPKPSLMEQAVRKMTADAERNNRRMQEEIVRGLARSPAPLPGLNASGRASPFANRQPQAWTPRDTRRVTESEQGPELYNPTPANCRKAPK